MKTYNKDYPEYIKTPRNFDKLSKKQLKEYLDEESKPEYNIDYYTGYNIDSLDI